MILLILVDGIHETHSMMYGSTSYEGLLRGLHGKNVDTASWIESMCGCGDNASAALELCKAMNLRLVENDFQLTKSDVIIIYR